MVKTRVYYIIKFRNFKDVSWMERILENKTPDEITKIFNDIADRYKYYLFIQVTETKEILGTSGNV